MDYGKKKLLCIVLAAFLHAALLGMLFNGVIDADAIPDNPGTFFTFTVLMFLNALVTGILCRIGDYRFSILFSEVVNVIYGYHISVSFLSMSNHDDGFMSFVCMAAVQLGVVCLFGFITYLLCRNSDHWF